MEDSSRHIVVGVFTGIFLSPLLGGVVAGYLNGPDSREMLRTGAVIGAIVGLVFAALVFVIRYPVIERQPADVNQHLAELGLIFTLSVLAAIFGAGFGNALAYRTGR